MTIMACYECGATFALLKTNNFNFCNLFHKRSFFEKNPNLATEADQLSLLYRWGNQSLDSGDESDLRYQIDSW